MVRESLAATVARHTAAIEDNLLTLVLASSPDVKSRQASLIAKSLAELERVAKTRMESSEYEYQRREGKKLADLARVAAPRRG